MAEAQEPTAEEQQPEQAEPHGTDWKAEARKWEPLKKRAIGYTVAFLVDLSPFAIGEWSRFCRVVV